MTAPIRAHHPFAAFCLLVLLAACGAGGANRGPLPDGPEPLATGTASLSGTVDLATDGCQFVQEREPNDRIDESQSLSVLTPGTRLVVSGAFRTGDTQDGFRLFAPERVRLDLRLHFDGGLQADFDVAVYDLVGMQVVELFEAWEAPVTGSTIVRGVFDLVLLARRGTGRYVLTLDASAVGDVVPEQEPNGSLSGGRYLGAIEAGDHIALAGWADWDDDTNDGWVLACEDNLDLELALAFPQGSDFDLHLYDITSGPDSARLLHVYESWVGNPEEGTLTVPAGTLLHVRVHAFDGGGAYTLRIYARPAVSGHASKVLAAPRPASPELEIIALDLPADRSPYGVVRGEIRAGEILVIPEPHTDDTLLRGTLATEGLEILREVPGGPLLVRDPVLRAGTTAENARRTVSRAARLQRLRGVLKGEANSVHRASIVPDDPLYERQWQYPLMTLPDAWEHTTGSSSVLVAVVDTGRTDHPDLAGRLVSGYDFVAYDSDPHEPMSSSTGWHGTHVAGTIGAIGDNGVGVTGVAWDVDILHVRVLGTDGSGSDFDVLNGILYAAGLPNAAGVRPARRAEVINLSLGGGLYSQSFQDALTRVREAGVMVVVAAGNDGDDFPSYPAAYDGVIAVGAVGPDAGLAYYSNHGVWVDLVAPGGDADYGTEGKILSTSWTDHGQPAYAWYQGTSMATPHVVGLAALLLAVDPTLEPDDIEDILKGTARDLGAPGFDRVYGHGLVDAYAAVLRAQARAGPDPALSVPSAVDLQWMREQVHLPIHNTAGGFLDVYAATVIEGAAWLRVDAYGGGDDRQAVDGLRVVVEREGLPVGEHEGHIALVTNGGDAEIVVRMEVLPFPDPLDLQVVVVVLDEDGDVPLRESVVEGAGPLSFSFDDLPAGSYVVVAGTDVDDDGRLGEEGELVGAPVEGASPIRVTVDADEAVEGLRLRLRVASGGSGPTYPRP